jgi:hypothetical protein
MKNNINKKIGTTLVAAAIMAGTAVIPMSNAAVERAASTSKVPTIKYSAHVQNEGWMAEVSNGEIAGTFYKAQRVEALKIKLENCENVTLKVKLHIQDYGDREFTVTAEDADKLIGTQWEAKRIEAMTITTEGLSELGYKLQYRVHVQDDGWQDWKDEGEMAGTQYRALRLEAVQLRIVVDEEAMAAKELKEAKAEAVSTLTSYRIALKGTLSSSDYKKIASTIETAIDNINDAETLSAMNRIYNTAVSAVKAKDSKIDETVKTVAEAKATAVEAAEEEISAYETAISSLTSSADKKIARQLIATAKKEIASAEVASEVTAAIQALEEGAATITGLDDAKDLKVAQDEANELLDQYLAYLNDSNIPSTVPVATIKSAISDYKANINKAKTDDEVDSIVTSFENYMKTTYKTVLDAVTETAVDEAVAKLSTYLKYTGDLDEEGESNADAYNVENDDEDLIEALAKAGINAEDGYAYTSTVKRTAQNAIDGMKNALSLGTYKKPSQVKTALDGYIETLEEQITVVKTIDAYNLSLYQTAYEAALETLNKYATAASELKLDSDITTRINNTKAKIAEVTTPAEVTAAMKAFEDYVDAHYEDALDDMKESVLEQVREEALATLATYQKSTNKTISSAANNAVKEVNKTTATADTIKTAVDGVIAIELEETQNDAIEALNAYLGKTTEVNSIIADARTEILAVETVDEVTSIKDDTLKQISKLLKITIQTEAEKLATAQSEALALIKDYQSCNPTGITLTAYKTEINNATTVDAVNEIVTRMKAAIATQDTLLDAKYAIIYTTGTYTTSLGETNNGAKAKLATYYVEADADKGISAYTYLDNADYASIKAIADKAITDVKAATTLKDVETLLNKATTDIELVTAKIDNLGTMKTTAKNALATFVGVSVGAESTFEQTIAESKSGYESELQTYGKKIDAVQIKDMTSTDTAESCAAINKIVLQFKKDILELEKAKKVAAVKAMITTGVDADKYEYVSNNDSAKKKVVDDAIDEVVTAISNIAILDENGKIVEDTTSKTVIEQASVQLAVNSVYNVSKVTTALSNIKIKLSATDFTVTNSSLTYDGSAKDAQVTSTKVASNKITVSYDNGTDEATNSPTTAGTYTMKVTVANDDNYECTDVVLTQNFVITKATLDKTKFKLTTGVAGAAEGITIDGTITTVYKKDGSIVAAGDLQNGTAYDVFVTVSGDSNYDDITELSLETQYTPAN